jgi:hypothetical protein
MKNRERKDSPDTDRPQNSSALEHGGLDPMRFVQLLTQRAGEELENWDGPAAGKKELRTQAKVFRIAFAELGHQLRPFLRLLTASERRRLDLTIAALMTSSHSIGEFVQVSPIRKKLDSIHQANAARKSRARAQAPKEKALMKAIRAELRRRPVRQPWKEAEAMESKINEKLEAAGHERVTTRVIYHRLKTLAAGSRSQKPRS